MSRAAWSNTGQTRRGCGGLFAREIRGAKDERTEMIHKPTHLDLFSGIGGFAIAAQSNGYQTIGFCEKEPYAQQILKERFGAVLADAKKLQRNGCEHNAGSDSQKRGQVSQSGNGSGPTLHPDIFTLNGADYAGVDLLTGGFPCQPFSVAGKRLGKADDRAIWPEMLRVIQEARPTWIIGENVAGIVTMELDNILSDLEALGYSAWPLVIPACAVDARHRRDRVWIVAYSMRDGRNERRAEREGQRGRTTHISAGASSEDVAHADQRTERSQPEHAEHQQHRGRQLEPSIRRVADGLPEGLDGGGGVCQWPEEDHNTPRVSTCVGNRAHRLRGLGNSICPPVAEEIIRAIRENS